jgi:hypothetical protein
MKLSATFINANGDTKPFDITEGFSLQDAFNVVANDDFAPTQINIQSENMNLPSYSLGSEQPVETAYDILGKYSTADIIAKHQISQQQLEPLLEEGANHELEHTSNILVAMKIAQDHLYEHLDYYKRLKQAKLAKGAVIEAVQNRNKYEDGGRSSFPIYTRMKNQIDKLSVMEFLRKYPQVESVMNQYVRTPNVKAGYLMFLSEKDMNDQNLEDWGATVKGTMTLPNGTKIKRYNWDFGNAEGFAEVFQYLYDKQNGYAKGGKVGADTSDKMVADAKGMSKQNYLNKYSVDITESYMDAKKQYEGHHKTDYPVTLGMFVDSLHTEYKALGGVTNEGFDVRYDKGGYIDEQMFVDQNLKKIDDIYVIDKNGNQQDSLGDFTLQGFGKYMMRDLAKELYDEYKIRLRSDFALMIGEEVINPSIKVVQKTGNHINYLALIYNALVTEEGVVSYVYNEDGEEIGKFTDEDKAQEYVDAYDGVYVEARVEEITQPETILSMQFDFDTHKMKFVSSLLDKHSTHEFKYGGKL